MGSKLYVGNLPFDTDGSELKLAFSQCGSVLDVKIVTDRETGRSRGFAFITMASPDEAQAAISSWDGRNFGGRNLTVNEAVDKPRGFVNPGQSSVGSTGGNPGYGPRRVIVDNPGRNQNFSPVTPPSDFGDDNSRKRRRGGSRARRQAQEDGGDW
jgi:cold-inducible RNA-binding protein